MILYWVDTWYAENWSVFPVSLTINCPNHQLNPKTNRYLKPLELAITSCWSNKVKAIEIQTANPLIYVCRKRRDADELFMVPHTKWCGKGNRADGPSNLGGYTAADRCCRQHDQQCPHHIPAWSEKFGLYNSRPYTAMHCTCDDR